MPADTPEFQFSQEALSAWDRIEARLWQIIRELVKRRAFEQQRTTITEDDIRACLNDAIRHMTKELQQEQEQVPA